MTTVWVIGEHDGAGSLTAATGELLTKARVLGDTVDLVALGSGASASAGAAGGFGAGRVFACDDPALDDAPRANAHVVARMVDEHNPDLVLFATTYAGRDIAGRLQARTGSALMSNATDVLSPTRARTEILGGTQIVDVDLDGPTPIVLMKPRSIEAEPTGGGPSEVVTIAADLPPGLVDAQVEERHEAAATGPSLDDAAVVVAGGRGLGGPEAFAMLDDLASAIGGAAVGASRAAVDAGWVPYAYQIGQTGRTVKPTVYLAVGISGALQHIVGMKGAGRIIAIIKDADAPIMQLADLAVVGDLTAVVPALTEEIRRRAGS